MARNGFKFFDSDTHVGPYMEVLTQYLTDAEKTRLPGWEQYKAASKIGHVIYTKGQRHYKRRLGSAAGEDTKGRSDYPHGESHFPHSVETVIGWDMPESRKRILFWDNALRLYALCALRTCIVLVDERLLSQGSA